ncbi:hypothetical protein BH20ACT2_BH20ACT2_20000 [soil metagenome]
MTPRAAGRAGWWSWGLLAVVLLGALAVGTFDRQAEQTEAERVRAVAETVKCPQCASQSVANSDAPAAEAVRTEIERRLAAGESPDDVRAYLAGRYGEDILLNPTSSGVTGLVWILPVVALVAAGAGLVVVFRRWQAKATVSASDADRARVAAARRARAAR